MDLLKTIEVFLWEKKEKEGLKGRFFHYLRVLFLAGEGFLQDRGNLFAAALTFFSLLSLVPILALAFAVAKGFGLDKFLEKQLLSNLAEQGEALSKAIEFAHNLLQKTRGEVVAGIGVIFLFWTVIKVFSQIETAFNEIWGVERGRSWTRKFTDYLSFFILVPFLFITANSLALYLAKKLSLWTLGLPFFISWISILFLKLVPLFLFTCLFALLYIVIPSTEVKLKPAFVAGFIIAILYLILQKMIVVAQVNLARFNAIYGSFAAFPLFVFWLNWSWSLVLLGAEMAFVLQNFSLLKKRDHTLSLKDLKYLSLYCWAKLGKHFLEKGGGVSVQELLADLPVGVETCRKIEKHLVGAGLVKILWEEEKMLLPAFSPHSLTVEQFWELWEEEGKEATSLEVKKWEEKVKQKGSQCLVVDLLK